MTALGNQRNARRTAACKAIVAMEATGRTYQGTRRRRRCLLLSMATLGRVVGAARYSARVGLIACPFCREMFEEGEANQCPVCGVSLAKLDKLPLSHDALHEETPIEPEHQRFAFTYLGRGRGPLLLLAVVGIALFLAPWVRVTQMGDSSALSGFDVAHRFGWPWSTVVAWFVLLPAIASRRSIAQLRSARVAATMLAAIPATTVAILASHPPHGRGLLPIDIAFTWPFWATLATSLVAVAFAVRLGGRVDDIKVDRGSSVGHTVH